MSLFHRKALAGLGLTAVAVASTALFAMPAQAATAGSAKVIGSAKVEFRALNGKSNSLTITISGRTVTLNDKVAIKAGKGCKAVKGDKTKVKCTTSKKTTSLSVALGDKNDYVINKTSVYMLADGGSGNDTLTGGAGKDQLQGSTGVDKLYGRGGADIIFGESGNDHIVGGAGNDQVEAGSGNDAVYGEAGNDTLVGESGIDTLSGGDGKDIIAGGASNDKIVGGAARDILFGQGGSDTISGGAGNDDLIAEDFDDYGNPVGSNSALDKLDGGANDPAGDRCLVWAAGKAVNCELSEVVSLNARSAATTAPTADVAAAKARLAAVAATR